MKLIFTIVSFISFLVLDINEESDSDVGPKKEESYSYYVPNMFQQDESGCRTKGKLTCIYI